MILDIVDDLNRLKIILASASPRRRELLERIGLQFSVRVSNFSEDLDKSSFSDPAHYNVATAKGKLLDVVESLRIENIDSDIVITCDTIVVPCDEPTKILEKADTAEAASAMIRSLAGKSHYVFSALIVHFTKLNLTVEQVVRTEVEMAPLSEGAIAAYVKHPQAWSGKAGAYGIQDLASSFIRGIHGDFYNVMGFPLCAFCELIQSVLAAHPSILSVKGNEQTPSSNDAPAKTL